MARRIGSAESPAKKRRHSVGGAVRAFPRRRQSRLSLPASSRVFSGSSSSNESEAPVEEEEEEERRTPLVTRQSTPASTKSAVSSAASSRRGRPLRSLQTLADSLGRPSVAAESEPEAADEPENEPPSAQDAGRQLRFDDEATDSDAGDAAEAPTAAAEE